MEVQIDFPMGLGSWYANRTWKVPGSYVSFECPNWALSTTGRLRLICLFLVSKWQEYIDTDLFVWRWSRVYCNNSCSRLNNNKFNSRMPIFISTHGSPVWIKGKEKFVECVWETGYFSIHVDNTCYWEDSLDTWLLIAKKAKVLDRERDDFHGFREKDWSRKILKFYSFSDTLVE